MNDEKYHPTDIELNAYVDGELDARTRAQIAIAVANDPALARRVAELSNVKADTAEAFEGVLFRLPDDFDIDMAAKPRSSNRTHWICVAAAVVAAIGGLGVCVLIQEVPTAKTSWRLAADKLHRNWEKKSASTIRGRFDPRWIEADVQAPDLSGAELTLTAIDHVKLGPVEALRFGYIGDDGCKLSLFVLGDDVPPRQPKFAWPGEMKSAEWVANRRRFVVLSHDKGAHHFDRVSRILEAWSPRAGGERRRRQAATGGGPQGIASLPRVISHKKN